MSVEAISWALNHAPITSPTTKLVLIALANHARPDGTASFPSVKTISKYTCLSERAIRQHLEALESAGIIHRCDQRIVAAYITRSDRRPIGYNINILGVQAAQVEQTRGAGDAVHGVHIEQDGVHEVPSRGAGDAPKPYKNRTEEPYIEPSVSPTLVASSQSTQDAQRLCELLRDLMVENGCKPPKITSTWVTDMERLMRIDERTPEQIESAIRWTQANEFWSANIHSPAKLREKYDTLRLQARRETVQRSPRGFDGIRQFLDDDVVYQ